MQTVFTLFFSSIFLFTCLTLVFELEYFLTTTVQSLNAPFFTVWYFIMITMSTIGYGDYTPQTNEGRFVMLVVSVWGSILISLFVTVTSGIFKMSDNEQKAVAYVDISREAAKLICKAVPYYKIKRQYYLELKKKYPDLKTEFMQSMTVSSCHMKRYQTLDEGKFIFLKSQMQVMHFNLCQAAETFKEHKAEWQKLYDNDTQSQVYVLSKVIKKEVFDIADTMDLLAHTISR